MTKPQSQNSPPNILSFIKDLPNICSLTGLLCAVLAIYFAILGNFPAAMIGLLWATFFDWSDGIIARSLKGRNDNQREFGGQLDSLIDIISYGICPALVLLSYGNFSPWFLPGAFIALAAGVLRLSYYNIFGLSGGSTYRGLALDNNVIILTFVFLFNPMIDKTVFIAFLYILVVTLAALNVAPISTRKLAGMKWFYALITYTVILSIIYGWQLVHA
jgi:phosphatidylserine synthase